MKFLKAALFVAGFAFSAGAVLADADDLKWVSKCIKDNADAKVGSEVVIKYCTCMNEKMDANETRSISQWEKSHPKEMAECEKAAGWK